MAGFDIETLIEFSPPVARCPRCLGLWQRWSHDAFACSACKTEFHPSLYDYMTTGAFPSIYAIQSSGSDAAAFDMGAAGHIAGSPTYVFGGGRPGLAIDLGDDVLAHATALARIARELRAADEARPPLQGLMNLLRSARAFVHFATFGLDEFSLGLLELAAQGVYVSGVVAGLDRRMDDALSYARAEAPGLEVRVDGHRGEPGDQNHGKLIVVDGLLAITGSANLTNKAWRKAAINMEIVDLVTDVARVSDLNNRHFSTAWTRLGPRETGRTISGSWRMVTPDDPAHSSRREENGEPPPSPSGPVG